jgi:hypothetical protein
VKPVDIVDLLDSQLSQQPTQPPIIATTNHDIDNQHHSNNNNDNGINIDDIDNIIDSIKKKPSPSPPPPPPQYTHSSPPSDSMSTQAPATLSESTSTFVHGVLPDHPLQGSKPSDQDHGDNKIDDEGGTTGTTEEDGGRNSSANIEGSSKNGSNPQDKSKKIATVNLGLLIAIIVMVIIFVLILIGVLKEHKYLRFRGAVCLRRGKVPIHSNGKSNGAISKLRSNPKKALHSLLGPSQLGFSRLRTYDSDSEEEEFPVFNRV